MEKSKARNRHTHTVHAITAIVSAPKGSAAHSPSQSLSIILGGGSRVLAVWECRIATSVVGDEMAGVVWARRLATNQLCVEGCPPPPCLALHDDDDEALLESVSVCIIWAGRE
jgi:hypothetical protein